MVDFHGWSLPVQYGGLLAEHAAVREAAGLFDVSHMGEIRIAGDGALAAVDHIVSNDCSQLVPGAILYTVACREDGGILDDLLVYRIAADAFLLVVNAANVEKMFAWIGERLGGRGLEIENHSEGTSQLALQGPRSLDILCAAPPFAPHADSLRELGYYRFATIELEGTRIIVSRTGYTGERGYEIYLPNEAAAAIADSLMAAGEGSGLVPAGLGARDTLRFEASYCLYGNELDELTDPYEAGLFWLVKMKKADFIGREALLARKDDPQARRLVGFALPDRKIARQGFPVMAGELEVGTVTSGSFSPTLERGLGIALVRREFRKEPLSVEIRAERVEVESVKMPFYSQPALRE
jgi:aminomethyltransferase